MKTRLKGAQKGHSLLKKKSDALTARFRAILKDIVRVGRSVHIFQDLCLCEPHHRSVVNAGGGKNQGTIGIWNEIGRGMGSESEAVLQLK